MRGHHRRGRLRFASAAIVLLIIVVGVRVARAELLRNGDLSKGSGNQPDDWRTEAWVNDAGAVTFGWKHPSATSSGELEVATHRSPTMRAGCNRYR